MMLASRFRCGVLLLTLFIIPYKMFSQAGVASLSGRITDPSGAIVVDYRGATLTVGPG